MTSMDHRREKNLHNYMFDCKISEKTEDVRNFPKEKNPKKSCLFKDFFVFYFIPAKKMLEWYSFVLVLLCIV